MRFGFLLTILLGFLSLKTIGQTLLKGYIGIEGGESFNYKLELYDSGKYVKGFSYLYANEKEFVKTRLTGRIDQAQQQFNFTETAIVLNKGFKSRATICLIRATLSFKTENNQTSFSGPITSSDITHVSCSKGTVTIMEIEKAKDFIENKTTEKPTIIKEKTVNQPSPKNLSYPVAANNPKKPAAAQTGIKKEAITSGKDKIILWETDTVKIYIWDGGKLDGDKISVYLDDELIIKDFIIKKDPILIKKKLYKKESILSIVAENEGNESPNTADIKLLDGEKEINILAYNHYAKKAIIKIVKKLPNEKVP